MFDLPAIFAAIFLLNLIPAFAPPTWMALSVIGFYRPEIEFLALAGVAALGATAGRVVLAKMAGTVVRNRWLGAGTRENIDVLRAALEKRRKTTAGALLFFAASPFPSSYLFVAYGLSAGPLWLIALPFLVSRALSYGAWAYAAQTAATHFGDEAEQLGSYMGGFFIASQFVLLAALYAFARIDWRALLEERKWRFLRRPPKKENLHERSDDRR